MVPRSCCRALSLSLLGTILLANGFAPDVARHVQFFQKGSDRLSPKESVSHRARTTRLFYVKNDKVDLEEMKETIDIVEVIESYNLPQFRRRGNGAVAVCPFHDDKNPSLSIDTSRQLYKCFSCGAGGNVFRFVQEYSKLPGNDELSFGQVLGFISTQFGDGTFVSHSDGLSQEARDVLRHKKERIILANSMAAIFFSNCLIEPYAGGARFHLRSRGISATSISQCMLGYARDCYFGQRKGTLRGEGSLVDHLRMLNFTATEIVEAGLATVLKSRSQTNSSAATPELTHNKIMDRFRGRLMVPIFDASGKRILGFGGRDIQPPAENDELDSIGGTSFKTPKYLNTPESLVFEKRHILFGSSNAATAIHDISRPSLLVVEGYMDAIALWNVGLGAAVATMGTAVTEMQLDAAAKLVASQQGRLVLCLDNDEAGRLAMERICSNGALAAVCKRRNVGVYVAVFPPDVKDPAEFLETYGETTPVAQLAELFEDQVMGTAVEWTEWYVQTLIDQFEAEAPRGSPGSFGHVFERVANYLASTFGPPDRIRMAAEVSRKLSTLLAGERETSDVSPAVITQLEADLVDMTAKLARDKDSLRRRAEDAGLASSSDETEAINSMINGGSSGHLGSKLASKPRSGPEQSSTSLPPRKSEGPVKRSTRVWGKVTTMTRKPAPSSLTPHYNGLDFAHKTDRAWLGISEQKKKQKFGLLLGRSSRGVGDESNDIVYFNSPDYNGHQFLTEEGEEAGYPRGNIRPDHSVIDNGLASLLKEDAESLNQSAEDSLLRTLVMHPSTRTVVKDMLQTTVAKLSGGEIVWSCAQKDWLFNQLIENSDLSFQSSDLSNMTSISDFLSSAPAGLLSASPTEMPTTESLPVLAESNNAIHKGGSLVKFFDGLPPEHPELVNGERPDLAVQSLLITLVSASQTERVRKMRDAIILEASRQNQLSTLPTTDESVTGIQSLDDLTHNNNNLTYGNESSSLALSSDLMSSIATLRNATSELVSWKKSAVILTSKLLGKIREFSDEGQIPESLQLSVSAESSKHLEDVIDGKEKPDPLLFNPDGMFAAPGDEPFEVALERMQEEWGDWYEEDYIWSPGDKYKTKSPKPSQGLAAPEIPEEDETDDDQGEESIEEFMERTDREYAGWEI